MPVDITPKHSSDFLAVLNRAATAFRANEKRPTASDVRQALLQAEKSAKHQRLIYPFDELTGHWRLCFATGTRKARQRGGIVLGQGFYVPKLASAHISFQPQIPTSDTTAGQGRITNQVQFGTVQLTLTGPCRYLGKKNLLAFDFTQIQIKLFERVIYTGEIRGSKAQTNNSSEWAIAQFPFFAFFLITPDLIAARGRGGGLALWLREHP